VTTQPRRSIPASPANANPKIESPIPTASQSSLNPRLEAVPERAAFAIRPSYVRSEYKVYRVMANHVIHCPTSTRRPDFEVEIAALDKHWQGRTIAVMLRHTKVGDLCA
jgi:hypothetical protein